VSRWPRAAVPIFAAVGSAGASHVPTSGNWNYGARFQAPRHARPRSVAQRTTRPEGHSSFYPADWSPVCGDQITLYNQVRPEFQNYGAEILGISVDGAWCHQAYAKHNHIHFPLLADFHPKGAAAQKYGAYREQDGVCERALFVIDRKGLIFWSYLSPIAVNPGADGILDALESLQNQEK
jgi:peroxiredoxin